MVRREERVGVPRELRNIFSGEQNKDCFAVSIDASQPLRMLIDELINRDSLQLTRESDLKINFDIKQDNRFNAPGDKTDAGYSVQNQSIRLVS